SPSAITCTAIPGRSSATPATNPAGQPRIAWRTAEIIAVRDEAAHARSLVLAVDGWQGHSVGQHVDVRLTTADGYQAERSYSISSDPSRRTSARLVARLPRRLNARSHN